jgi:S-adenosyl-L-methionine hydrolase (adenosine-forming)
MARPVIALLTDFGTRDHYVGAMKGVVLGICPDATIVDITHEVPPQDVLAGALELAACHRYFPHGTIFVGVVDPGVGSSRRGLAAEAGPYRFVAPDNGLLAAVFEESPPGRVIELTERRYTLPEISRTFEGRDRFAPAAGWIARGVDLAELGHTVSLWEGLHVPRATLASDRIDGEVLRVDRFGNLITNIHQEAVARMRGLPTIVVAGRTVPFVSTYSEVPPGELCGLIGSSGRLEIAVNGGAASERLIASRGTRVSVVGA